MSALPSPDSIPPLRSQPEQQQHPENIIDLTSDTTQNTPSSNTSSENMDPHLHAHGDDDDDDDDDDIIFTGENRPVQPPRIGFSPSRLARLRSPRPTPRNRSSTTNPAPTTNPIRSYSNLPGQMAALTANIYAGYYSRNPPRPGTTPHQGSSNLHVRDSPAPQTRRPINIGGGGRFSGGNFSGFVAAGLSRFQGLLGPVTTTSTTHARPQPPQDSLHRVFTNWPHDDDFDRLDGDRLQPFGTMAGQLRGNFLSLSPRQIIAAIYDFDPVHQPQEPLPPSYKEQDSHPLKIKSGFSKEIIPLDREVLSVDSDSHSHPQLEKQDLRPVCASCDEELLMGQDSCTADLVDGRRPWILACGHVVDSRCLEQARTRSQESKFESHQSKKTRAAERLANSHYPTRAGRSCRINPVPDTAAEKLANPSSKRRKISSTVSIQGSSSSASNIQAVVSDSASKRKERAEAREARKSIEFLKPMSSHLLDSHRAAHSTETNTAVENVTTTSGNRGKGKGKAKEEADPVVPHEDSSSIIIPPTPHTAKSSSAKTATGGRNHLPKKPAAPPSWIKCPVKGCRGAKGDLLAAPGSKNAPWEMFV